MRRLEITIENDNIICCEYNFKIPDIEKFKDFILRGYEEKGIEYSRILEERYKLSYLEVKYLY